MALTLQQQLDDARTKLHKLITGSLRVQVREGDVQVTYTQADKGDLERYIASLEQKVASESGGSVKRRRPAGVRF